MIDYNEANNILNMVFQKIENSNISRIKIPSEDEIILSYFGSPIINLNSVHETLKDKFKEMYNLCNYAIRRNKKLLGTDTPHWIIANEPFIQLIQAGRTGPQEAIDYNHIRRFESDMVKDWELYSFNFGVEPTDVMILVGTKESDEIYSLAFNVKLWN